MIIKNRVMHTPEGMRDLYGKSLQDRRALMKRIHDVFESFGYSDIETPTIEYFDVFSSDIGTTPSNELYKFFDRDGNTLVLRPDFTPSVARAAAMHFADSDFPLRLSYEGSTFVNSAEYQGRLKESRQMGVELIGEDSAEADAEIIALTCRMLLASGLREFQVSVGEVNFYKALADKSGLDEESTETIRELISNKNFFGVAEVLDGTKAAPEVKEAMQKLPQLFGSAEIFDAAEAFALGKREKSAVTRLRRIHEILCAKGLDRYVSFDFGLLSKYNYYTGIIFSAFTYGTGEPVARGGRYDLLLGHFGRENPAVGVGLYIDQLTSSLIRQGISYGGPAKEADTAGGCKA